VENDGKWWKMVENDGTCGIQAWKWVNTGVIQRKEHGIPWDSLNFIKLMNNGNGFGNLVYLPTKWKSCHYDTFQFLEPKFWQIQHVLPGTHRKLVNPWGWPTAIFRYLGEAEN
jgi:hypothetical protein